MFICQFCDIKKPSKRSLDSHKSFCKNNPQRSSHDHSLAGRKGATVSNTKKQLQKNNTIADYSLDPNKCITCNKSLPYANKSNKFCNHSCAASYTNRHRTCKTGPKKRFFLNGEWVSKPKLQRLLRPSVTTYSELCKNCGSRFWSKTKKKTCSEICRLAIFSRIATNNPKMGGNKNYKAYGWYVSPYAGRVWLESSWEHKVAKSLDENNVAWIRPDFLKYDTKKYFPDFYLPEHDVYLEPKNPFLVDKDKYKLEAVRQQNNVKIILLNKDQLCWAVIKTLL